MNLRVQPVQVAIGGDSTESQLVFQGSFLVAVLVRLSDEYEADAGKRFLKAGFGRVDHQRPPTFVDLGKAQMWIIVSSQTLKHFASQAALLAPAQDMAVGLNECC